jgi:hypothetical protein
MKNHPTEANRKSDKKKKMELEWTHITQRSTSDTENSTELESSGTWNKRWAEENAAKDNRG